uniref:Uncharacterized protein n=1 Tax=Rhizophora mucronata TaxID=61149 RepID=A0A2P2QHV5_RHIMU
MLSAVTSKCKMCCLEKLFKLRILSLTHMNSLEGIILL